VLIQKNKKYVVYDKLGKVVIITVDRNAAISYAKNKCGRI
jgi:hypothetical protein